jgi:hypothetical protein
MTDYQTWAHSEMQYFPILVDNRGEVPGPGGGVTSAEQQELFTAAAVAFAAVAEEVSRPNI